MDEKMETSTVQQQQVGETIQPKELEKAVLEFRNPSTLLEDAVLGSIELAFLPNGTTSGPLIAVKYNQNLFVYRFDEGGKKLQLLDAKFDEFDAGVERGRWYLPKEGLIVTRNGTYQLDEQGNRTDLVEHVPNSKDVLLGKFFKDSKLDALVRDSDGKWKFMTFKDSTWNEQADELSPGKDQTRCEVQVVNDFIADNNAFVVKTEKNLCVYKKSDDKLDCIAKCEHITLPEDTVYDQIAFANFSDAKYKDLLHFNTTGLNVYRFNETTTTYDPHFYSTMFSKFRNWNADLVKSLIVHDMDGNGRDELLFTAPAGFQVFRAVEDGSDFYLDDVVLKSANDTHRFMNMMAVLPKNEEGAQRAIFTGDGKLFLVDIENTTMTIQLPLVIEPKPRDPSQITLITPAEKYSRWLHEQLDLSELLQPLNSLTGKVELTIPLVQLDNPFGISVRRSFQYRDVDGDDYLGRGWSFPLDYIGVDPRGSLFEQDYRYYLVRNNVRVTLVPNFVKSTNETAVFEVEEELVLEYFKREQRWKMESKEESMKYIFGNWSNTNGLRYVEQDKEWKFPIQWYLVREEDAADSFVNYGYEISSNSVKLLNVTTDQDSSVKFNYEGNKMKNFLVETKFFTQNVNLEYVEKEGKRNLTGIIQDGYPLFGFKYESDKMVQIVYPNGLNSTLEYTTKNIEDKQRNEVELASGDFTMNYGPDYSIIVSAAPDKMNAQVNVRDVLGGLQTEKTFNTTLSNQTEPFTAYQVVTLDNVFGIIRSFTEKKILDIFHFTENEWNNTVQNLSPDAIVVSNVNSIYIADEGSLRSIGNNAEETRVQNITSNFVMRATNRGVYVYDDSNYFLRYSSQGQYLKGKHCCTDKHYIKDTLDTVNRFKLNKDTKANLERALKLDMIQMYKNFIILRALEISKDGIMTLRLRQKILNEKNEIYESDHWRVSLKKVDDMKLDVKSTDGDACKLGYIELVYLNKYATTINCTGPTVEGYEKAFQTTLSSAGPKKNSNKDEKKIATTWNAILKFSEQMAAFEKRILDDNPFAFDVSLLGISVDEEGIKTGGQIVSYNGTHWSQRSQEQDVNLILKDKLKLVKTKDQTYRIQVDEKVIYDSNTTDSRSVKLVWPHYFASQSAEDDSPSLYLFDKEETVKLDHAGKLSLLSNNMLVVTTDNDTKLSLLPVKSLLQSSIEVLAKQTLQLNPQESRITSYENEQVQLDAESNAYVFIKSKIVPGGNETEYGWYEHSYDPKSRLLMRKVMNSDGKFIKYVDPENAAKHEVPNSATVITDKAGRLPIVDIGPMLVADGEYLYYGFEEYERNTFNVTLGEGSLKKAGGNRYLKLENESTFEASLQMQRANETYLFTCWLKTEDSSRKVGDIVNFVEVKVPENDKEAVKANECKVQHIVAAGWFYVELNITTANLQNPTTATVTITPETGKAVGVDHVRFSPMNVDFRAYIYHQPFWGISRVMHNSGLMLQYLLDPHGNRVVYVSELGKVTDFITYSKSYYIRSSDKLPLVMEVRPRDGEIECFNNNPKRWIPQDKSKWSMGNGSLTHKAVESEDKIKRALSINCESFVVRFVYNLKSANAVLKIVVDKMTVKVDKEHLCKEASKDSCKSNTPTPDYGEIVLFVSKTHRAIWFEGSLISEKSVETSDLKTLALTMTDEVTISEMLVLYDPSMKITYYNRLGLPRQTLIKQDEQSVRIKEVLYDDIDRSIISTKWTTVEKSEDLLFGFHDKFIEPVTSNQLNGQVNELNKDCEGYPYFRKDYAKSPNTEEVIISMPGKNFSENTKYSRQIARTSKFDVLEKLFPAGYGYTQMVEIRQNKTYHISVHDVNYLKVAYFVAADNSEDRITTYDYDVERNLILELPPMYHHATATLNRTEWFYSRNLTQNELELQRIWGVHYTYNEKNQLLSKRMPDSGTQHYIYDGDVVRFLVHLDHNNETDKTVFFSYGSAGQIVQEAVVNITAPEFGQYLSNGTALPNSTNYVEYYHGEYDESPSMRHRSQQSIRRIDDKQMMESLMMDNANRIRKKIYIVPKLNTSYSIDYEYLNDKLKMIRYPIGVNGSEFKINYGYNNAGDMISIGTMSEPERFLKLDYNADGLVREMHFEPGSSYSYKRELSYNQPGYLKRIADSFLEETVSYLEADGYGSVLSMIFEGLISRTTFNATWYKRSNPALSTLQVNSMGHINKTLVEFCIYNLQSNKYFDERLHPRKSFYPKLDGSVSEACRSKEFRTAFHANEFPLYYGHSYDYDNHEQLVRSKYFQSPTEALWQPLVETSFTSIKGIEENSSREIWNILMKNNFISTHCYNPGMCHGIPGSQPLLNPSIPKKSYTEAHILYAIYKNRTISEAGFTRKCLEWFENAEKNGINCTDVPKKLAANKLIGANSNQTLNALAVNFREVLTAYSEQIRKIVRVLHRHFATRLGESPADVVSYDFDPNGNSRLFRQGSIRYAFNFASGTNQICTITKIDGESSVLVYEMEHNGEGSVTVARHKNITKIVYDPLLNRPSTIEMQDGRKLKFEYDVRGERTFKQVIDKDDNVVKEKYYIRDLNRNVLVDVQLTFLTQDKAPDVQVTSYVYSDRGLVGFVRNDEFYSVFADHEGSTRLVIKNGEVKAAYDYLPFGIIFRKSERDLDGSISYLYTGQEWDEETGLYNYHTRLYDPEIGRFYQVDPKSQYASPYLYAGNSPLGMVDPDGQFFMTLIAIALAVVGAYLGAAAANGSWNPVEWNWKSPGTWLGLITGAIVGAALPSNVASTFAYLTVKLGLSVTTSVSIMIGSGIGFTYLAMAAANYDWNPDNWDMKSPGTWNAFFSGVSTSVSIITNPHNLISSYSGITSTVGKGLFIGGKLILTTGIAYMLGVIQQKGEFDPSKWDFSKPGLYMALFNGAMQATATVNFVTNLPQKLKSLISKISNALDSRGMTNVFSKLNQQLGSGWAKTLSGSRNFLKGYAGNIKMFGRGAFDIFLYTTVCSLRITKVVQTSNVKSFAIAIEVLKSMRKFGSASNRIANSLELFNSAKNTEDSLLISQEESHDGAKSIEDSQPDTEKGVENAKEDESKTETKRLKRGITSTMEDTEFGNASSGASKLFRSVLDFISFRPVTGNNPPTTQTSTTMKSYSTKPKSPLGKLYTIPNCFQLHGTEHANPFVKCYGHRSQVSIHYRTSPGEITLDRFHGCSPLTYNGIPSVSCEGEQSSLLFAAYDAPRLFDYADGWILLARVMPTAVKNIVSGVRGIFDGGRIRSGGHVSEEELASMKKDRVELDDLMKMSQNSEWAKKAIAELNEDIAEFLGESTRSLQTYWILKERIAALYEDVLKDVELTGNGHQRMNAYPADEPKIRMQGISQEMDVQSLMKGMLQHAAAGLLS